jgi:hypothetical protein
MSDLVSIFLLSVVAMFNPSLLAAVTVMLLMPNPKRLMVGRSLSSSMRRFAFAFIEQRPPSAC